MSALRWRSMLALALAAVVLTVLLVSILATATGVPSPVPASVTQAAVVATLGTCLTLSVIAAGDWVGRRSARRSS